MVSRLVLRQARAVCQTVQPFKNHFPSSQVRHASAMAVPTSSPPEVGENDISVDVPYSPIFRPSSDSCIERGHPPKSRPTTGFSDRRHSQQTPTVHGANLRAAATDDGER